jgi:hypothetical protein
VFCLIDRFIFHISRTDKKKRERGGNKRTHIEKKNEQEKFLYDYMHIRETTPRKTNTHC